MEGGELWRSRKWSDSLSQSLCSFCCGSCFLGASMAFLFTGAGHTPLTNSIRERWCTCARNWIPGWGRSPAPLRSNVCMCVCVCVCVCVRVFGKDASLIVHSKLCPSRTLCWPDLRSLCSLFPCQFLTYMLTGRRSSETHTWLSSDSTLLMIVHCLLWPSSTLTQFWLP